MDERRSSLSYLLQGSFFFSNYDLKSDSPSCFCHSNRFGKTLVAFPGADFGSVIICLSDHYLENQFDGGEVAQPIEYEGNLNSCGTVTEFCTQLLSLSSDSTLVAIKTSTDLLIFHSSIFFCASARDASQPLQVYLPPVLYFRTF